MQTYTADHDRVILDGVGVTVIRAATFPDGTRRFTKQELSKDDRYALLRFADLYRFHEDGKLNIELTAAEHDAYYERKARQKYEQMHQQVPHRPKDPVGRNAPCPCGATKTAHREELCNPYWFGDYQVPVKYKNCCLGKSTFDAGSTEEPTVEDFKEALKQEMMKVSNNSK